MPSLDRFAYGIRDAQQEKEMYCCDECGGEIYAGDEYFDLYPDKFCSERCVLDHIGVDKRTAGE